MRIKEKIPAILKYLDLVYGDPRCELDYNTPYQLLIATILSAQCTDKQVNKVTPTLFDQYPTADLMSIASLEEIETLIHSTGFYKNKAKNIKTASKVILEKFNGILPYTLEDLITLPGVGRKTANVLLGNAFNVPGVVVDTHMLRVSSRLGLTKNSAPVKVEFDLMKILSRDLWTRFSHQMVLFGRYICKAKKPECESCNLKTDICNYYKTVLKKLDS